MSISKKDDTKVGLTPKLEIAPENVDTTQPVGLAEEQQEFRSQTDAFHTALSVVENMNKKKH